MSTAAKAVQRATYTALNGNLSGTPVYDQPPENPGFPYVTIGDAVETMRNTMGKTGRSVLMNVDVWSRSGPDAAQDGFAEAHTVAGLIDGILDNTAPSLAADGWVCVICQLERSQPVRDNDGVTRLVRMQYRWLVEA